MLKRMVGCAFPQQAARAAPGEAAGKTVVSTASSSASNSGAAQRLPSSASSATATPTPAWTARTPTREELEARRIAERNFVTTHDTTETDLWYLIDVEWLSDWKLFVLQRGPLPGPIRNDVLADAHSGQPRPNLELVSHYRGVNAVIWKYWVQRYGGGPAIRRVVLDLYSTPVVEPQPGEPDGQQILEDRAYDVSESDQLQWLSGNAAVGSGHVAPAADTPSSSAGSTADDPKRGKATRRSFSDMWKGYRGGGRMPARSSGSAAASSAKATPDTPSAQRPQPDGRRVQQATRKQEVQSPDPGSEGQLSSTAGDSTGMTFFVKEADTCVVAQPTDGSCLFHSLAYGLDDGSDAASLRLDISNYIAGNPDMEVAGTSLKDWIKFDSGGKVAAYAAEMAGGTWGGGIEIEAFVRLKVVNVHVYESCPGGYRRICCFDTATEGDHRTVRLLYQGREHYDALACAENAGKWVPRAGLASHAGA